MADVLVKLEDVRKVFGGVTAVEEVSLDVLGGEFFSLLGPSGSGKTTCLRMIAGFEAPTSGRILLQGQDVSALPPYERDVNTVFQDYALFPHMSVAQNVEYGLKVKRVPRDERRERVSGALESVQLEEFGNRKPGELSGGQRQRVALARALVNEPEVLLLDEPLGALDLKLRQQMQVELKSIQERAGITFIYVTHDQEEALTMSDRLAVMNGGRIEQVGTPSEVYEQPSTSFVAGFVGVSNVLSGRAAHDITGDESPFTIRPEKILMSKSGEAPGDTGGCTATGRVTDISYLGAFT
nr:ABC transporter ATP-binding protein [Actinomycetota bacterium]